MMLLKFFKKTYSTTNTGLTAIPSSYSGDLWDMNGQSYSSCPNLKNIQIKLRQKAKNT